MKRYRRTAASQYVFVGIILASVVAIAFLSAFILTRVPFVDKFAIPWAAGRAWLLEGTNPYDEAIINMAAEAVSDSQYLGQLPDQEALTIPITNLAFYLPFSLIPFAISRAIWVTILAICIGLMGYLSLKLAGWSLTNLALLGIILLLIVWLPGIFSLLTGELSPIIIFLVVMGIYLIRKDQDTTAGFLLALTFGSVPTTFFILAFIVFWSLSRKRWSILGAYFSGVAFIMAVTLLMLPSWPLDLFRGNLAVFENWNWVNTPLAMLAATLPGVENPLSIFLHAVFLIYFIFLVITTWATTGRIFIWKMLVLLVVAYLLNPQASIVHLFLILPAAFLVFRVWSERWGNPGRILSWLLIILAAGGSWVAFLQNQNFTEIPSTPFFTIGIPLLVFIGMIWTRWWALNIRKLPFEKL